MQARRQGREGGWSTGREALRAVEESLGLHSRHGVGSKLSQKETRGQGGPRGWQTAGFLEGSRSLTTLHLGSLSSSDA